MKGFAPWPPLTRAGAKSSLGLFYGRAAFLSIGLSLFIDWGESINPEALCENEERPPLHLPFPLLNKQPEGEEMKSLQRASFVVNFPASNPFRSRPLCV